MRARSPSLVRVPSHTCPARPTALAPGRTELPSFLPSSLTLSNHHPLLLCPPPPSSRSVMAGLDRECVHDKNPQHHAEWLAAQMCEWILAVNLPPAEASCSQSVELHSRTRSKSAGVEASAPAAGQGFLSQIRRRVASSGGPDSLRRRSCAARCGGWRRRIGTAPCPGARRSKRGRASGGRRGGR